MYTRHGCGTNAGFSGRELEVDNSAAPTKGVSPPREVFKVLVAGASYAKAVVSSTTIDEKEWTKEPRTAWGNARDTLEIGLALGYPKLGWQTLISRMRLICTGGTFTPTYRPRVTQAVLPWRT